MAVEIAKIAVSAIAAVWVSVVIYQAIKQWFGDDDWPQGGAAA